MKQNNKKFNNALHKFVGVLDKYDIIHGHSRSFEKTTVNQNVASEVVWTWLRDPQKSILKFTILIIEQAVLLCKRS